MNNEQCANLIGPTGPCTTNNSTTPFFISNADFVGGNELKGNVTFGGSTAERCNNLANNVIGTSGPDSASDITCWSGRTGVNDEPLYKQHYATYELIGPTGPTQVILISNPYHC